MSFTTVQDLLTFTKKNIVRVSDANFDNNRALDLFNEVVKDVEDYIATYVNTTYYQQWVYANLVAGQNAYSIPTGTAITASVPQLKSLLALEIQYQHTNPANFKGTYNAGTAYAIGDIVERSTDLARFVAVAASTGQALTNTAYWKLTSKPTAVRARQRVFANLDRGLSRYETEQDAQDPFFMFDNNTLRIFPTPKYSVANGLRLIYARTDLEVQPADLGNSSVYNALTIPRQYHKTVLCKWLAALMLLARGRFDESDKLESQYERAKQEMVEQLLARYATAEETESPLSSDLTTRYMY